MAPIHPDAMNIYRKLGHELTRCAGLRNKNILEQNFPRLVQNAVEVIASCGFTYESSAVMLKIHPQILRSWIRGQNLPAPREQNEYLGVLAQKVAELLTLVAA